MKNWVTADREQLMMLPPSIDDLVPQDHLARFVVDVVEQLDLSPIMAKYERRGRGSRPYHPSMLLALLFYGYATGVMSSRKIERACQFDLAFRFVAGGHAPDHDTIATFRRRHLLEIADLFVEILQVARELGFLKVGTIAIDGTKIRANASKHAAVSYKRAQEIERKLREEVGQLMRLAEEADNTPLAEGVSIPAEIARREDRIAKLQEAQRAIEMRHAEEALEKYEEQLDGGIKKTKAALEAGKSVPKPPEPPDLEPPDKAQHNFTDADSRIMPDKGSFSQAYNAQACVDVATMLIIGQHISQRTNDKKELLTALDSIAESVGKPTDVIADAGYFSEENIAKCPARSWIAPGKTRHNQTLEDRVFAPKPTTLDESATPAEKMRQRLATEEGRSIYRLRKMTVEPAFGIIKSALGLRQFLLRGAEKIKNEWALVCLGYKLKRMWSLKRSS
jgi:transposase/predicted transcriptional regulator